MPLPTIALLSWQIPELPIRAGNAIDHQGSTRNVQAINTTITLPPRPGGGTSSVNPAGRTCTSAGVCTTDFVPDGAINFWDVSPPGVSAYLAGNVPHPDFTNRQNQAFTHEIVPRDSDGNDLIDALDFFIQDNMLSKPWDFIQGEDNTQTLGIWDPSNNTAAPGHPDTPANRPIKDAANFDISIPRGLRDSSLDIAAFRIGEGSGTIPAASFDTQTIGCPL